MNLQPNSLRCFVCGVENDSGLQMRFFETDTNPVEVVAEYNVPERFQGYPGIVHGGIVAAMLDEVTSRTVFRGDPLRYVVTVKLSIRYRKPVPISTPLRLIGRVVEDKGKVIVVAGEIYDPKGKLLAEAETVLAVVSPEFFGDVPIDLRAWKVYPDEQDEVDHDP
jgi:uncharacterized protein (TIGR00369 family)